MRREGGRWDRVGAGGTFRSGRGRGKKENSTIMGERRPAPELSLLTMCPMWFSLSQPFRSQYRELFYFQL